MKYRWSVLIVFIVGFMMSCSVQNIEKYNEDFKGDWRTEKYYISSNKDSVRNFFTVDGKDSGFGVACDYDDPFNDCVYFEGGKIKYNKANQGIQIGNSITQIHTIDKQPFINDQGKWEVVIDSTSYYKY